MRRSLNPISENLSGIVQIYPVIKIETPKKTSIGTPRKPLTPVLAKLGKAQDQENAMVGRSIDVCAITNGPADKNEAVSVVKIDCKPGTSKKLKQIKRVTIVKKRLALRKCDVSVQTEPTSDVVDCLTSESPPQEYWKELLEERSLALEETLQENQKLVERVEELEAENKALEELVKHAHALANMVTVMASDAADESGIGNEGTDSFVEGDD